MQISTGNKICSISLVIKEIYKKKKEIYTVGYHCTPTRMPTSTKADTMWWWKCGETELCVAGEDANGAAAVEKLGSFLKTPQLYVPGIPLLGI